MVMIFTWKKANCHNRRLTQSAPDPRANAGAMVVGLPPEGAACAFSGNLRGLELVPEKWRYLVLPTSGKRAPLGRWWLND